MSDVFCCSTITPYRPRQLDHEAKFRTFTRWAGLQITSLVPVDGSLVSSAQYAIQLVKQVNYGPQESIRYFIPASNGSDFAEATEDDLLKSNFEKLNSTSGAKSTIDFLNSTSIKKNPTNAHHWRINLARPSRHIDPAFRRNDTETESNNKVEESAGQEEKRELLLSETQGKTSFPEMRTSLSQALQETDEAVLHKTQTTDHSGIATLKGVLRFLLPTVGTSLGANRLLTLLCLDWINVELKLGLDFENFWKAETTSSNIINFFTECLISYTESPDFEVELAEVQDLVIPAMRHVESRKGQHLAGQVKFHEIVNKVLESGCALDWVSMYGGNIARVFASGPGELLDRCQRRNDRLQQHRNNQHAEKAHDIQNEKVREELTPRMSWGEYGDCDFDCDYEPMKDLTACDKECGYCGNCDY